MRSRAAFTRMVIVGLVLAKGLTAGAATPSYRSIVMGQNPLDYYRMDTLIGEKGDALIQNGVLINQSTPTPVLRSPTSPGLEEDNTWGTFNGGGGDTLTGVVTGWSSQEGSVSFWVRVNNVSQTGTCLMGRKTGGGGSFPSNNDTIGTFIRADGTFGLRIDGRTCDGSTALFTTEEWHHLVFTWNRNSGAGDGVMRIYLDGVEVKYVGGQTWDSFVIDDAARFGKELSGSGNRLLKGSADELAIWTRELTYLEVLRQYTHGTDANNVVVWADSFQGIPNGGLNGQSGWFAASAQWVVRNDTPGGWKNFAGEWAYLNTSGDTYAQKNTGQFAQWGGIVTFLFSIRADASRKCLFSIGYHDGASFNPCFYAGTRDANPNQLRVIRDASGVYQSLFASYTTAEPNLMRCRFVADLNTGKGHFSQHDGTQWQSPANVQDIDLALMNGTDANDPMNWNMVRIHGKTGATFDSLRILYEVPSGTMFIFR